jgi:hypothetical protein
MDDPPMNHMATCGKAFPVTYQSTLAMMGKGPAPNNIKPLLANNNDPP